jgi:L,D-peptidoglycan transpeptidase YkuD (ErfK/YbiS/YcfS/YnhG family)
MSVATVLAAVVLAACPHNVANGLASTHGASQLVTVEASGYGATTASLSVWARRNGCWRLVHGPLRARVGRTGLADRKREGDGATPTGAYPIGSTVYGIAPNPGVAGTFHRIVCGDWWDEDPSSSGYNTFRHVGCGTSPPFGGGSEALWQATGAYRQFAVVEYNAHPIVPGRGSAIFLHDDVGGPTNGCVSLPAPQLVTLLRWLRPAARPLIVIGTAAEIRRF